MLNNPYHQDEPPGSPASHLKLQPIPSGSALEAVGVLDRYRPGFLADFLRSKPVLRHAVLAVLAQSVGPFLERSTAERVREQAAALKALADVLFTMMPREMIEVAYGACPEGVLGAFSRIGDPLGWSDYVGLIEVMGQPAERLRQQVLLHTPRIDSGRLQGLLALDPALCLPRLARKVRSLEDAETANDVLMLVRSHRPDLSDEAVREFVSQGDALSPLRDQLGRLLDLVDDLGPPDFQVPEDFIYLRTRSDFRQFGVHYRNCLASKFEDALTGRIAVLAFRSTPAVAVLLAVNSGWLLGRVHVDGNGCPSTALVEEVRARLAAAGVPFVAPAPVEGPRATVRHLLMRWDPFGIGPDEFEAWTQDLD